MRRGGRGIAASLVTLAIVGALLATITDPPAPAAAAVTACDGVVWSGNDGSTDQIWTANADGTDRDNVSDLGLFSPIGNDEPQWSPGATHLTWSGESFPVGRQIQVADADGSNQGAISHLAADPDPTGNRDPQWSPDGTRLAWEGHDGATLQIYVADTDGTDRTEVSTVAPGVDPIDNFSVQWSPDGTRIVWSGFDGVSSQIWVADFDGANRMTISDVAGGIDPTDNEQPQWSPDGSRIVWTGDDSATRQVWVADADGSNRTMISTVGLGADPTENFWPQWSPDGTRFVWSGFDSATSQVWVADADGTDRVLISEVAAGTDPTSNEHPQWSPDGGRVGWEGHDGSTLQIYVADSDGTDRALVSDVDAGTDPTSNNRSQWRPRVGEVELSSSVSGPLVVGGLATASVTVTAPCPMGSLMIDGLDLPCLDVISRVATVGSVSGSGTWTIDLLDGTATATITGTVVSPGDCATIATVASAHPALAAPSTTTLGGMATDPVCDMSPTPFTDVSTLSFAFLDIACIFHLGITTGTSPTTYDPFGFVTREQMGAFLARLWRALGGICPLGAHPFTDVPASSFAFDDIACIYLLAITTGTGPTTFDPLAFVTREQMAAFLARLWRAAVAADLHI